MSLSQIFLPAVQREIIREIPDERVLPYGGPFGGLVPDQDRYHNQLQEIDAQSTTAARIVPHGASSVRSVRQQNQLVMQRAVQMVRHEEMTQEDMVWLSQMAAAAAVDRNIRDQARAMVRDIQERNRQSLAITRGYLVASMIVGEIDWSALAFNFGTSNFGMPAEMKLVPSVYWRNNAGTPNASATPIANFGALDYQVRDVWGMPAFDTVGMSYQAYLAMTATTEYQNQARAVTAVSLTTSLPVNNSESARQLAERVLGKRIVILDHTFQVEDATGARTSKRYVPERLAVLWRQEDEGKSDRWEFSKVPVTKKMLGDLLGSTAFTGGDIRGPLAWAGGDSMEFTHAAIYAADEGIARRKSRGVTAVIETRGGA
jgi:hypothetical protein